MRLATVLHGLFVLFFFSSCWIQSKVFDPAILTRLEFLCLFIDPLPSIFISTLARFFSVAVIETRAPLWSPRTYRPSVPLSHSISLAKANDITPLPPPPYPPPPPPVSLSVKYFSRCPNILFILFLNVSNSKRSKYNDLAVY